jgi:hypothetical protein
LSTRRPPRTVLDVAAELAAATRRSVRMKIRLLLVLRRRRIKIAIVIRY